MVTPVNWATIRPCGPRLYYVNICAMSITYRPHAAAWALPWRVWASPGNHRAMRWHAPRPLGGRQTRAQTPPRRAPAYGDPEAGGNNHHGNPTLIELLRPSWATSAHPHHRQSGQARAARCSQRAHGRAGVVDYRPLGSRHTAILPHDDPVALARMAH